MWNIRIRHSSSLAYVLSLSPSNLLPECWGFFLPMHLPQYICDLITALHRFPFYVGFRLPSVSSPSAGVFSFGKLGNPEKLLRICWKCSHSKFYAAYFLCSVLLCLQHFPISVEKLRSIMRNIAIINSASYTTQTPSNLLHRCWGFFLFTLHLLYSDCDLSTLLHSFPSMLA